MSCVFFVFFKQKTAYEMRISDWSSDVCSSDLLQLSRLLDGGVDKGLDRGLAEEAELAPAEASDEALHAGEPDPLYLDGLLTQHGDARAVKDVGDLLGLAAFIIMVAEDGAERDRAGGQTLGKDLGFLCLSAVGEVAAQGAHAGPLGD